MPERKPCRWLDCGRPLNLFGRTWYTCKWPPAEMSVPWWVCGYSETRPERECVNCPCYEPKETSDE